MGGIGDGVRERPGDLRRVHARAPGKINVFFEVGDVQPDGYHDVASVYQAVSLYEDVWASRADSDAITVDGDVDVSGVPLDASNLAVRAARLVADRLGYTGGIRLEIHKGVPVAGGMGGGSADAAATLCSNVYLDCFPPMDSSASLPNARYTHCHSLTVSRGTDRASAAGLQPTPASKSSTARLLDSRSCFTLRSILMENLPFPDVQEMGGSSPVPLWWFLFLREGRDADGRPYGRRYCR